MIFQCMQIICKRKANTSLPTVEFPSDFILTYDEKHWDNESLNLIQKKLGVKVSQKSLHLGDAFKAQTTDLVNAKLDELNAERIMVPKNMTHLLQPLDLTTNSAMEKMENFAFRFTDILQFYRCYHKKIVKRSWEKCNYHGRRLKIITLKTKTRKSYVLEIRISEFWERKKHNIFKLESSRHRPLKRFLLG